VGTVEVDQTVRPSDDLGVLAEDYSVDRIHPENENKIRSGDVLDTE
jgi:hypothetical protein